MNIDALAHYVDIMRRGQRFDNGRHSWVKVIAILAATMNWLTSAAAKWLA